MHDFAGAVWRTSSRSNDQGLCVEVADNLVDVLGLSRSATPRTSPGPHWP